MTESDTLKKPHNYAVFLTYIWRRNRGSNPGALLQTYKLSKPAPSTTWVFLQLSLLSIPQEKEKTMLNK